MLMAIAAPGRLSPSEKAILIWTLDEHSIQAIAKIVPSVVSLTELIEASNNQGTCLSQGIVCRAFVEGRFEVRHQYRLQGWQRVDLVIEHERRCPSIETEDFSLLQNSRNEHSPRLQEQCSCSEPSLVSPVQTRGYDSDNANATTLLDILDLPESRFSWQRPQSAAQVQSDSIQGISPQPCGKDSNKLTKEGYNFASNNQELPNHFCIPEDRPDDKHCTDSAAHVVEDSHDGGRHAQGASLDTCFLRDEPGNRLGKDEGTVGSQSLYDPFTEQPLDFRFWFAPENGCSGQSRHSKFAPGRKIMIREVANELWADECRGRCDSVFVRPQPAEYSAVPDETHVLVYIETCQLAYLFVAVGQDSDSETFSFSACAFHNRFVGRRRLTNDEIMHGGLLVRRTILTDAISFMQDFEPIPGIELIGQHQISDEVPSTFGSVHYGLVGAQETIC